MVFDQHRHRRHLGHFYVQNTVGAKLEQERRDAIKERKSRSIPQRLVSGACRGVFHFICFLIGIIPKAVGKQFVIPSMQNQKLGKMGKIEVF